MTRSPDYARPDMETAEHHLSKEGFSDDPENYSSPGRQTAAGSDSSRRHTHTGRGLKPGPRLQEDRE